MSGQLKRYRYIIFILCYSVIACRLLNVSVYDSDRARNHVFGDGFSDINTLSSAKYFYDSGFTQTAFLPVHDYYPMGAHGSVVYTHYPALPNILAGCYTYIFQTYSEPVLRIIPALLSIFLFFFIYHVMWHVLQDEQKAFIGASVILLSNYFIAWADNLHQHLYGELLKWVYFYVLYRYYEGGRKNMLQFVSLLLIMLVEVNISYEQPVYLGMLTLGFSIIYTKRIFTRETIDGFFAIVAGFFLHVLQNVVYSGSWDWAMTDLKNTFLLRTAGVEHGDLKPEAVLTWSNAWMIPFGWINRMERYYLFPGLFIIFIAVFGLRKMKADHPKLYRITWATLFASVAWSFVMTQHAYVHIFTSKHFCIWYALVCSYSLVAYTDVVKSHFAAKKYAWYPVHFLAIGYAVAMCLTQQVYELYIKFGWAYPHLGR